MSSKSRPRYHDDYDLSTAERNQRPSILATQLYKAFGPARPDFNDPEICKREEASAFRFAIGFSFINMLFPIVSYYVIEKSESLENDQDQEQDSLMSVTDDIPSTPENITNQRRQLANISFQYVLNLFSRSRRVQKPAKISLPTVFAPYVVGCLWYHTHLDFHRVPT